MVGEEKSERALILVKALPRKGDEHGEVVCCAGVTEKHEWRRQYPVRFRHLKEKFKRWQWIEYKYRLPKDDDRVESRRVLEDSIKPLKLIPKRERVGFLKPLILPSVEVAAERGQSLTLIRPVEPRLVSRRKTSLEIEDEKRGYEKAAQQHSLLDDSLNALIPCFYQQIKCLS